MTKRPIGVAILGSTGSIGRQTIDVIRAHPELFEVVGLSAGSDGSALQDQATELGVDHTGLGPEEAAEIATIDEADVVVNAIVGAAGLSASIAALEAGKRLALANKESLIVGGRLCLEAAGRGGGHIVAVDSEHSAIAQCLAGRDIDVVARIVLTASGGPFRTRSDLTSVTVAEALAHPTWSMGPKITVDSATLMNKGFEVIEAHHLFGLSYDRIDILVHPQSVVHGIVELVDGAQILHAAPPDMRIPIAAALSGGDHLSPAFERIDLGAVERLDFEPLDAERFPAPGLAYEAGRAGGTCPAVLNAANEVAVRWFLDDRIAFSAITAVVDEVLARHEPLPDGELEAVLEADSWARAEAERCCSARSEKVAT